MKTSLDLQLDNGSSQRCSRADRLVCRILQVEMLTCEGVAADPERTRDLWMKMHRKQAKLEKRYEERLLIQ